MKEVSVRRATEQDTDAILRLWREMQDLHEEIEPMAWTTVPDADSLFVSHLGDLLGDPDRVVFVAVQGEAVVGYLIAAKMQRPPVLSPCVEGGIQACCVTRSARREGIGRRLVAEAMDWFRAQGLTVARASYALDNAVSVPFWKAEGFRPYMVSGIRPVDLKQAAESASFDDRGAYFGSVAETYDRLQPIVAGPAYARGLAMVLDLVPYDGGDAFRFIELGCGTATLTRSLLDRFPASRGIALDTEPAMLEVARRKLAAYGERVEVRQADILTCDLSACDVVLSAHTFHHLPPDSINELLGRISGALCPGGCFILLDQMTAGPLSGEGMSAQSRRLHERHLAAAIAGGQTTQEEIEARAALKRKMQQEGKEVEYRHSAEGLADAMRAAGFDEIALVWRMFARTILMGLVPEGGPQ